jgi:putative lipoic acid-binding regulatory protein
MPNSDALLSFPCEFPLKVIGRNNDDFRSLALGIVQKHAGPIAPDQITERPSKDGNYLALTYTFQANSRAQLDALYAELTACERVLIVL